VVTASIDEAGEKFLARLGRFLVPHSSYGFSVGFSVWLSQDVNLFRAVAAGFLVGVLLPTLFTLAPMPLIFRLLHAEKSLSEIALGLGSLDPEIRRNALTQLLQRKDAVPILLKVLDLPAGKNEF
jgi:hypothetical protein